MFIDFFQLLRSRGVPVTLTEWMALMDALALGLERASLVHFYALCRSVCVKSEAHFDTYDQCFAEFFRDVEPSEQALDEVLDWLEDPILPRDLTDEELAMFRELDLDELRRQFEERLAEQDERHDGGSHWVGTGGTSPFGHSGTHPGGIRVGGSGRRGSARQIATERRFRNLRGDRVLDTRQISVALRRLRLLTRTGREEELDLDATIDATARNAGDIELVFRPERKNRVKLLLLMDVGGSMDPYAALSERLFSAAHAASHFKSFRHYFFHNCPYETLYEDIARRAGRRTEEILGELDESWFCIFVGDAAMHPDELLRPGGAIDYFHQNRVPGINWLDKIGDRVPRSVWLNPDPPRFWGSTTTRVIGERFPMFPLTVDGIADAVDELKTIRV